MAIYAYSFLNKKRDLSDILSTVVKDEPRFISNFKTVPIKAKPQIIPKIVHPNEPRNVINKKGG